MKTYNYEDFSTGDSYESGPYAVSEAEIIEFAEKYDPQPFHTDPKAAEDTVFKGLAASGWHTAAMSMNLLVRALPPVEGGGMIGKEILNMKWQRPVRPGDVLHYKCEITEMRSSKSKPEIGIIRGHSTTYNQNGETVQTLEVIMMAPRRNKD